MPDYCTSHIWCSNPKCGVPVEPSEDLPKLPRNLAVAVEAWGALWVSQMWHSDMDKNYFKALFNEVGLDLANQINKYYHCEFDPDNESNFYYQNQVS